MAYANITYTYDSGSGTPLVFVVPFEFLKTPHVKAKVDVTGIGVFVAETGFTVAGDGNSVTFAAATTGGSAWISGTTKINVYRETPIADADRIVDFQSGSVLTEEDLDNSALQLLYASQESADVSDTILGLNAGGTAWDADTKPIGGVVDPIDNQQAATKKYVDDVTSVAGNLPAVGAPQNNFGLFVNGTAWAYRTQAESRAHLETLSQTENDARYLVEANNLSDLPDKAAARGVSGLDLGSAAQLDAGLTSGDVVALISGDKLPAVDGSLLTGLQKTLGFATYELPVGTLAAGAVWTKLHILDAVAATVIGVAPVVVDTADDEIDLEASTKYIIDFSAVINNTHSSDQTFGFQLWDVTGALAKWQSATGITCPASGFFHYRRTISIVTTGAISCSFRAFEQSGGNDTNLVEGHFTVTKIA